jgi:hypothetical protein
MKVRAYLNNYSKYFHPAYLQFKYDKFETSQHRGFHNQAYGIDSSYIINIKL